MGIEGDHSLDAAFRLAMDAAAISDVAQNEAQLRHELEEALRAACGKLSIPWTPFQLERPLKALGKPTRFADVAHGAVVIEYEPPRSFSGQLNGKARHARRQAEDYARLIAAEEGRPLESYVLVVWDGAHISFGVVRSHGAQWEGVVSFDVHTAEKLLNVLATDGIPLVHPQLLKALVGPDSTYGRALIPRLFMSVCRADSGAGASKTQMLYREWRRLFSQVVGFQPGNLKALLSRQNIAHNMDYESDPAAYLFALNTYIALIAKVVAACSLPRPSQNILDSRVLVAERLRAIETGVIFESSGIANMLGGDFFSWYLDDPAWSEFESSVERILSALSGVDFDVTRKDPGTTRDLFKGILERFVPREVRHILGEYYTPDWLAEHALDQLEWDPWQSLCDPTCGSGTFLLEAIRRRRIVGQSDLNARELLSGLSGIDLNPLAVLVAKSSLAVFLSPYLDPSDPVRLPVYLADAINPATSDDGCFAHSLETEIGVVDFRVPEALVRSPEFFAIFGRIRELVDSDFTASKVFELVSPQLQRLPLDDQEVLLVRTAIDNFVTLHNQGWNGIWCAILADRFAAGSVAPAEKVAGNPPWVRWSNLPVEYARAIRERCRDLGVFSDNKWVGGIESDISTVVTFLALKRYLAPHGKLGFFLPGSVLTTPSSAGFRKLSVGGNVQCRILRVEDFDDIRPFDSTSSLPRLLLIERDAQPEYPVPFRRWKIGASRSAIGPSITAEQYQRIASFDDLQAHPVPGGQSHRPWVVGSPQAQMLFAKVFGGEGPSAYRARKGVTADRNGVYWVYEEGASDEGTILIRNAATIGKTTGIPVITARIESEHLFPLLRGQGVKPFCATPDENLRIVVAQRGMHGDPDLPASSPLTFKYFSRFKSQLSSRSSLRRFQKGKPFYSLWSTGSYTFAPYKVLWREIGKAFAAAYVGSSDAGGQPKVVIPDHKLYFIPVETEAEAAYLTGFLNAPLVSQSVSAYAAQLSLGASVAEYLRIPKFDQANHVMQELSDKALELTRNGGMVTARDTESLDRLVAGLLSLDED
jgi:N-6 DNA Methylase